MTQLGVEILKHLRATTPQLAEAASPRWLSKARWKPEIVLRVPGDSRLLAVDVIASASVSRIIYREAVAPLLKEYQNLRVDVCVLEEGFCQHPDVELFCKEMGIGLKVLLPGLGLQTVVRTDFDPEILAGRLPTEDGWIPSAILKAALGMNHFQFASEIDRFIADLATAGSDQAAAFDLVKRTIDTLLAHHPTFAPHIKQFMRLSHFETLLRFTSPNSTEHVFHSFRVFLAGCPIINQFYDVFQSSHERFCLGPLNNLSVEYTWLLASVFHDIGRPKEGVVQLVEDELQDEDFEVKVIVKDTHWLRPECRASRDVLASLAAFVATLPSTGTWDAGAVPNAQAADLAAALTALYGGVMRSGDSTEAVELVLRSHAVIGSLDFLAEVFRTAAAANEAANRSFVVTHAVPAALAILLHDWRIWEDARAWKLFPINSSAMPMAALLIYLDTWDDYRRRGSDPLVFVRDYAVDARGARVTIEWGDSRAFEREKVKYEAFKSALRSKGLPLKIIPRMASQS